MPRCPHPAALALGLLLSACTSTPPDVTPTSEGVDGAGAPGGDDLGAAPGADLRGAPSGRARPGLQTAQRYFPDDAPWYRDVSAAKVSPESSTITSWMVQHSAPGGWGGGGQMRIDFSIVTVDVPAGTPRRAHQSIADYYYAPDCDTAPVPVVPGGAVEQTYGSPIVFTSPFSGYSCAGLDRGADCHMLFVSRAEGRLYEIYHGSIDAADRFRAGCLAVWDTRRTSPDGRGQQCTSADAAGFPIAPLLFTAEEVAAGQINHAIRFILPNDMLRRRKYVAPATHGTNTTGPLQAGPYGFRLRLRAGYPVATLGKGAQVVARAMQKYGMLLADGGQIALTAQSDVISDTKWAQVGLSEYTLSALKASDFEVIDFETPTDVTYNCTRTQITN